MERREFSKSTAEQILEYRQLFKAGVSLKEIGRRFHKDHSSISYWIKKGNGYLPNYYTPKSRGGDRRSEGYRLKREAKESLSKDLRIRNKCILCHQPKKNKKWAKTDYCSLDCWQKEYERKQPIKIDPIWGTIRA